MTLLLLAPLTAISKGGNGKGGGKGNTDTPPVVVDYGDIFGDLIHIRRNLQTGQPIFAQRWVEMPEALPGYGWGYCAIAINADGDSLPFKPYSCEIQEDYGDQVVEVDYFGRLNGSRVQERNQRMHFNETITNIQQAVRLRLDPTGRLALGFADPDDPGACALAEIDCLWSTVDSPMENMALYQRMMKYGHIATDPLEVDLWWHGDPALGTPYHPALSAADWAKFEDAEPSLAHWLPPYGEVWDNQGEFDRPSECFDDGEPVAPCLGPEELTPEDFDTSADLLGAAGGKHNFFTMHLVQYLNRFLRITQSTEFAEATLATLPAQVLKDCVVEKYNDIDDVWEVLIGDPWTSGDEAPDGWRIDIDLAYDFDNCLVSDVDGTEPNHDDFWNIQERFMDFVASAYQRGYTWNDRKATVALEAELQLPPTTITVQAVDQPTVESKPGAVSNIWLTVDQEPLIEWIGLVNPTTTSPGVSEIQNFVDAASDTLRAIEFFHNYGVPENLYCTYLPEDYCPDPDTIE